MVLKGRTLPEPASYRQRRYRLQAGEESSDTATFNVKINESDLLIRAADAGLRKMAGERLMYYRHQLEVFLAQFPEVRFQLSPFKIPEQVLVPDIVATMVAAAGKAGVGPMAAVAGVLAEAVGRDLLAASPVVMIENGGDVFLAGACSYTVGIFAGRSPFSDRLGIRLKRPEKFSAGICTSSATVGHSLSLGKADAMCVYADSAAFADALATAMGNRIRSVDDLNIVVEDALAFDSVHGAVAILGDKLAAAGEVELIPLSPR